MKPHLRLVRTKQRPLANLSRAEKLARAIAYLRNELPTRNQTGRNLYLLDQGTPAKWGIPGKGGK